MLIIWNKGVENNYFYATIHMHSSYIPRSYCLPNSFEETGVRNLYMDLQDSSVWSPYLEMIRLYVHLYFFRAWQALYALFVHAHTHTNKIMQPLEGKYGEQCK
jgi:hypothetical protein